MVLFFLRSSGGLSMSKGERNLSQYLAYKFTFQTADCSALFTMLWLNMQAYRAHLFVTDTPEDLVEGSIHIAYHGDGFAPSVMWSFFDGSLNTNPTQLRCIVDGSTHSRLASARPTSSRDVSGSVFACHEGLVIIDAGEGFQVRYAQQQGRMKRLENLRFCDRIERGSRTNAWTFGSYVGPTTIPADTFP